MIAPSPEYQVQFLRNLQRLLVEGQFVATYKYALLLALADIAVEKGDDSGDPLTVPTSDIAEKFVEYYWRQCVPYVPLGGDSGGLLRQNTGSMAAVIRLIEDVRRKSSGFLPAAKTDFRSWQALVRDVAQIVRVMPLWKLQRVGNDELEFLYENRHKGTSIELRAGVVYCLRQFYGLVSEMVRGDWVRYVRRQNLGLLGETADLFEFLFGSERADLSEVQPVLEDLQGGMCFYCRNPLRRGTTHVDHFIPWSRYPVDLGHNFVLSHNSCNRSKADYLAAPEHLAAWSQRNRDHGDALATEFGHRGVMNDLPASERIVQWAYVQTEASGGSTWVRARIFVPLESNWRSSL